MARTEGEYGYGYGYGCGCFWSVFMYLYVCSFLHYVLCFHTLASTHNVLYLFHHILRSIDRFIDENPSLEDFRQFFSLDLVTFATLQGFKGMSPQQVIYIHIHIHLYMYLHTYTTIYSYYYTHLHIHIHVHFVLPIHTVYICITHLISFSPPSPLPLSFSQLNFLAPLMKLKRCRPGQVLKREGAEKDTGSMVSPTQKKLKGMVHGICELCMVNVYCIWCMVYGILLYIYPNPPHLFLSALLRPLLTEKSIGILLIGVCAITPPVTDLLLLSTSLSTSKKGGVGSDEGEGSVSANTQKMLSRMRYDFISI
ncbi:hypothetical protein EON63_13295 [archaeon]|nr:MAG: hypothetical protein EON63_13295 [archaeon]